MSNVLKDIDKIKKLAKKVHTHIEKNKISKAKKEIKRIMGLNADEYVCLSEGNGDKKLIEECQLILQLAKKALQDLDSVQLFDEAKELIDSIVSIENKELIKISESENEKNKLYQFWHEVIYPFRFYHGTTDINLDRIKKYGLVPGMVPWDRGEIERLNYIVKKAGSRGGIGRYFQKQIKNHQIFWITSRKKIAMDYAKRSPEMWSEFVGAKNWINKDLRATMKFLKNSVIVEASQRQLDQNEETVLGIYNPNFEKLNDPIRHLLEKASELLGNKSPNLALQKGFLEEVNKKVVELESSKEKFEEFLKNDSLISKIEFNELIRITNKYWNFLRNGKQMILTISPLAPSIKIKIPKEIFNNFNSFFKLFKDRGCDTDTFIEDFKRLEINSFVDLQVHKRIPPEYILKYEYMGKEYVPFEVYSELHHQSEGFDVGMTESGTWGRGAAGILVVCPDLGEVLLLKRSANVEDPNMWGIPGGARKETSEGLEDSIITAATESNEEMGGLPKGKIRSKPYIYHKPGTYFTFETFILEIDPTEKESFVPNLNWENTDYRWMRMDLLSEVNLHPGVREVLNNYKF